MKPSRNISNSEIDAFLLGNGIDPDSAPARVFRAIVRDLDRLNERDKKKSYRALADAGIRHARRFTIPGVPDTIFEVNWKTGAVVRLNKDGTTTGVMSSRHMPDLPGKPPSFDDAMKTIRLDALPEGQINRARKLVERCLKGDDDEIATWAAEMVATPLLSDRLKRADLTEYDVRAALRNIQRMGAVNLQDTVNKMARSLSPEGDAFDITPFVPKFEDNNEMQRFCFEKLVDVTERLSPKVEAWLKGPLRFSKPQGSSHHALEEFLKRTSHTKRVALREPMLFVVEHDWAGAFSKAVDFDGGEIRLPAEYCCFEFRIDNRSVLYFVDDDVLHARPKGDISNCPIARFGDEWAILDEGFGEISIELNKALHAQVRAILIALDAEVAETEIVRENYKANREREKRGKLPMRSFHVVNLSRRSRASALPDDHEPVPGTKKRMHFRRGHWRHYPNHKTWINWMLVGNPDLGFIDKEYRL